MRPEDCKPGVRVWYEPSPGIRFLGEVTRPPRLLGAAPDGTWVTDVAMLHGHYGRWRAGAERGISPRMSVPAAALDCLHLENEAEVLREQLALLRLQHHVAVLNAKRLSAREEP